MDILYFQNKGGWLSNMAGTGAAIGTIVMMLSSPVEANVGTGGMRVLQTSSHRQTLTPPSLKYVGVHPLPQRSIPQNIDRIRDIIKPSISELATIFGVSRQAVYNWLSGDYPIEEHVKKIEDMAAAADIFAAEGIALTAPMLRRKISSGKSLLEIAQSGGSALDGAQVLVRVLRRETEQRKVLANRLVGRVPTNVNNAELGVPAVDELA